MPLLLNNFRLKIESHTFMQCKFVLCYFIFKQKTERVTTSEMYLDNNNPVLHTGSSNRQSASPFENTTSHAYISYLSLRLVIRHNTNKPAFLASVDILTPSNVSGTLWHWTIYNKGCCSNWTLLSHLDFSRPFQHFS